MKTREKNELFWDSFAIGAVYGCVVGLMILLSVAVGGCTTTRPRPPQEPPLVAATPPALPTDSLPDPRVSYRRPPYVQSLPTSYGPLATVQNSPLALPKDESIPKERQEKHPQKTRKGVFGFLKGQKTTKETSKTKFKNVVINQIVGNDNNLSNAGKKADAAPQATDSSLANTVAQGGNLAAVHGNDNQLKQKADAPPAAAAGASAWWKWLVAGAALGYLVPKFAPRLWRLAVPLLLLVGVLLGSCAPTPYRSLNRYRHELNRQVRARHRLAGHEQRSAHDSPQLHDK